jgi:hypothetical protein
VAAPECPVMRNLVLSALLVTLPLGGMRVICLNEPADLTNSTVASNTDSGCERLCARHHSSSDGDGSNCALTTDPCALIAFASTSALCPEESLGITLCVSAVPADVPRYAPEPELARRVPPPKPQVLQHVQLSSLGGFCDDQLSLARATALV